MVTSPPRRTASNLCRDIKNNLPLSLHAPLKYLTGTYATIWLQTFPQILPQVSNHFWATPTVPWSLKMQVHRARWGRLWNKKLAYRWKLPYATSTHPPTNDHCPICRTAQDGASHILAGCSAFLGHYISRHDAAVKIIWKSISQGLLGGYTAVMDAGTTADLPNGVTKTMPSALCPPNIQPAEWAKFRPDIALIHPSILREGPEASLTHPIHLVEVGYCSDTNHEVKHTQKQAQHARLLTLLKDQGYKADLTIITLGTTSTIPISAFSNLESLGLDHHTVDTLLHRLHRLAVKHLGHILFERRRRGSHVDPG